ncbi:TolC family protein [Acidocella sp. KAb 2-4]|jgi:outer membrane protein TolC|uniref:TolC family protein n=1 Tax=Acidocella sp. KAb 2-4 TaxID=2885158 RepID=UPI001D079967|nr:TolC family protein [Acidocella sp. KAb 2-4]MCB5945121.1 TolC family protein [Acidocella sp. KAb 2-4]MDD2705118.1 TolC family protein [Acidocella sp.]
MKRMIWLALAGLSGCAAYHPAPLHDTAPIASSLPATQPLTLAQLAALAVQRDPDLTAARAQAGIAQAELLAAGTPPDPSLSIGFEALLGGPASMSSLAGSLVEDVSPLITRSATINAAKAHLLQVNADILWQEWQVAARAEQLGVALTGEAAERTSLLNDEQALTVLGQNVQAQTAAGNLTQQDESVAETALAILRAAQDSEEQAQARDEAQLDALLAVPPGTPITLAPPAVAAISSAQLQQALATLPQRRPDLLALRYGYTEADEKLRAAIRSQFLPISLGGQGGRDTSGVTSAGPQVTLSLPLFNRNRPAIKTDEATRAALHAQYDASLADTRNGAEALGQSIALLQRQNMQADQAAAQAVGIAANARRAFVAGGLDARAETDLIIAAGQRQREGIQLRTQLQTAKLSLAVMLGLGLPVHD